jgi:hypothetical protein
MEAQINTIIGVLKLLIPLYLPKIKAVHPKWSVILISAFFSKRCFTIVS